MAQFHYQTPAEKQRAALRRAADPKAPPTATERALQRQAIDEGTAKAGSEASKREQEAAAIAEKKCPRNYAREIYELHRNATPRDISSDTLRRLKQRADEEDQRISDSVLERDRQARLAKDPNARKALGDAETKLEEAGPEQREERARCLGIARQGDPATYWAEAAALDKEVAEKANTLQVDAATTRMTSEEEYLIRKEASDKAVSELRESMANLKTFLESKPTLDGQ